MAFKSQVGSNGCTTTVFVYLMGIILLELIFSSEGFLPKRTSRWWDKKMTANGPPISNEEKYASLQLKVPPFTPYSNRYMESNRLIEGDIYWAKNLKVPKDNDNRRILKGLMTWPDAEVPYLIENTFSTQDRLHVARALTEIESNSCVRFVPRDGVNNFIYIHKGKDCASNVGRIGGGQPVSLAPECMEFGIILHELLHSLGFWHEQSRYDRRNYVDIHWTNIKPLMIPNFLVSPYYFMSDVGLPYDFESILHYSANSFALDPEKPTISPKIDGVNIGQRQGLSKLNAQSINLLYECESRDLDNAPSSHDGHHKEVLDYDDGCLDLYMFCLPTRMMGGCWWGDYLMRRFCRKSCGQCS